MDVVFKKALKEFRLNIFNSYSTALAVSIPGEVFFPYIQRRTVKSTNVTLSIKH